MVSPFFLIPVFAQGIVALQLFNSTPSGIPSACGTALTTNITCPNLLSVASISNQQYVETSTLASICTPGCASSLLGFQSQAVSACGTTVYTFPGNISQAVQQFITPLVWAYNVSCLTSGTDYCYAQVTSPNGTVSPCSDCFLQYEAAMLESSYGQVRVDSGSFSSLLSSCGVPASSYPYSTMPSATTTSLSSSTPTTTSVSTCTGSTYTVNDGDTCDSIAAAHSIATDRFLTENHLDYNCSALTVGNQVCLGASCALHTVTANDTCDSILASQTFYLAQFLSWNPSIHSSCDNLDSMIGRNICISPPGSSSWDVTPTNFTTDWNVTFILPTTAFTTIPSQTAAPNYTTSWFVPTTTIPNITVSGTASSAAEVSAYNDLLKYCPIGLNDTLSGWTPYDLPDDCLSGLLEYCSPSVNATMPPSTSFPATCSPSYYETTSTSTSSSTYSPPAPEQTGIASNCDAYYIVQENDTCAGIVSEYGNFTLSQFYGWNPAIGTDCGGLKYGYAVCIGVSPSTTSTTSATSTSTTSSTSTTTSPSSTTPSPLMPSTDPQCTKYHYVVSTDNCAGIESEYGITAAQFAFWNPYIGAGCSSLWLNYYVCVGAPDQPGATSTGTSTSTATTTGAPSPLEPSTDPSCTKWHLVVAGDSCESIETTYGITAAEFNAWNPYVGSTCASLWAQYYVCVAAP